MGIEIDKTEFTHDDFDRFSQRLDAQLAQLSSLLERPDFGAGCDSIGAELELYIIDHEGRPAFLNQTLQKAAADPQLTLELNQYNLEYNLSPQDLNNGGLGAMELEVTHKLTALAATASDFDAKIVPIGILPTLRPEDFGRHCVTDRQRYRALIEQLIRRGGSNFNIDINGAQPLQMSVADISLEGANTSFQVHLRVDPANYACSFNAAQLVTPLGVALSANSPSLFGHELWCETRIPLFKQSIDTRHADRYRWHEPPRVSFGEGWVRDGALELFCEAVRLYPPLLPACAATTEGAEPTLAESAPELAELRLHQSTVWLWNRPVYDDADGGHLRIELRALPAGPTAVDMVAGAAFMTGLVHGLRATVADLLPSLPFTLAEHNFYRGAKHGLDARLVWPSATQRGLSERPVAEIIAELLPTADAGLAALGVSTTERDRYLGVIEGRLSARQNGASWQRRVVQGLVGGGAAPDAALQEMLHRYCKLSASNTPVAQWSLK